MNYGWIKAHRKILDNPIVTKDNDYFRLWFHLLLNATHEEYSVMFHNKRITLHGGQLTTGRNKLSKETGIQESKVRRILERFESEQMIDQETDHKCTLITICNWYLYQNSEQVNEQVMTKYCTSDEQVLNTKQEIKNKENDKKDIYGKYKRVRLTKEEYQTMINDFGEHTTTSEIMDFDEYKERTRKEYPSDYLTMRNYLLNKKNIRKETLNVSSQRQGYKDTIC